LAGGVAIRLALDLIAVGSETVNIFRSPLLIETEGVKSGRRFAFSAIHGSLGLPEPVNQFRI
jgi:hypothetical protein